MLPFRDGKGKILNLSLLGLAIQVEDHCRFARGERHCLTLSQGPSSIDVEGIVCWTDSSWDDWSASRRGGYRQTAGFSIETGTNRETKKEWRSIADAILAAPKNLSVSRFEAVHPCNER